MLHLLQVSACDCHCVCPLGQVAEKGLPPLGLNRGPYGRESPGPLSAAPSSRKKGQQSRWTPRPREVPAITVWTLTVLHSDYFFTRAVSSLEQALPGLGPRLARLQSPHQQRVGQSGHPECPGCREGADITPPRPQAGLWGAQSQASRACGGSTEGRARALASDGLLPLTAASCL